MGYTESYACGVQIRPHSEARETEAGITEESCVQKKHTALAVVSITQIDSKQSGLTLIQILVGVVVLGVIAAVVLAPRLLGQAGRALQTRAAEDIETLGIALDRYAQDSGDYPSTEQGLKALWEAPEEPPLPINWLGPYIQIPITEDPWGNPYIYIRPGVHDRYGYDLISFGSDGLEGGSGENEDIVSWIRRDE